MQVTLSERKLSERIRELEGITDSIEEICDRMPHYAGRLFAHIAEYGVRMQGMIRQNGGLGTFQFELSPIHSDEARATRLSGLSMMNPNSLTVEYADLPGLFQRGLALSAMSDAWTSYCHELQGLSVGEIGPTLERLATKIMFGPMTGGAELLDPQSREEYFQSTLQRAGLKDPGRKQREIEEYRQREEAAYAAQQQAAHDAIWNRED